MKIIVLHILLCLSFAQSQDSSICPPKVTINPCTCKIGRDSAPWISCENLISTDQLVKACQGMVNLSVSVFHLDTSSIGVLPSDVFSKIKIRNLNIISTNLTKLGDNRNRPAFLGLENSLETLEIKDAFIDENSPLSTLSLSHLKKLSLILLNGNIIPTIGNNWFESGPYSLRDVHLYNTRATTIGSHAFAALQNLRSFVLTGGFFKNFTREMLPLPANSLESIDLSNNKLKTLSNNMFTKMPSLEEVYLESNGFTTISEIVWAPVWNQLISIFYYGNPITCDKNMTWIYKYRLPENFKGYCVAPPKLRNRDLDTITLSELE